VNNIKDITKMKKHTLKIVAGVALAAVMTSCSITMPVAVSNAEIGSKKGVSTTTVIGAIYLNKNFGIKEAAKNGKITGAIATIDKKVTNYVIVQKIELIVTSK